MNHFDMARELAHLEGAGMPIEDCAAEMLRKFPTATVADVQRAILIGLERLEILEEERAAAAESLADQWFGGAEPDRQAIDTVMNLKPSAEPLFPKPDRSKS
jgi:hypothetical protein